MPIPSAMGWRTRRHAPLKRRPAGAGLRVWGISPAAAGGDLGDKAKGQRCRVPLREVTSYTVAGVDGAVQA
ncbi:hypothetical protein Msi02_85280 [Microbispora siamensis]|uniref:Uncharacterized protein n=1 Tax=Microbispora siamensis TaxID=564413 RepID=A0ABQ4H210_9ACTN|nr:hypothetical protein Msi02_85280 [Microbispora siamensis]